MIKKQPYIPASFADKMHMIIEVRVANNPRQLGTHSYYAFLLYRPGMTVAEYLTADYDNTLPIRWGRTHHTFTGPKPYHLGWDIAYGFVTLIEPSEAKASD